MLFKILLSLALATTALSDCVIHNNGTLPPGIATGDLRTPMDYSKTWTKEAACPEFRDVPSCCTDASNSAALDNFQKLSTAFGNAGAGCDLCAANIRRFFCYFACDPRQSDYMTFNPFPIKILIESDAPINKQNNLNCGFYFSKIIEICPCHSERINDYEQYEIWNSTSNQVQNISVLNVSMGYNANEACELFGSCAKISFLTEISAGGSALGFFTFLFDRGLEDSSIKVLVSMANQGGLQFTTPVHKCNESYPSGFDDMGYPVPGTCPCNFCTDSCEPLEYVEYGNLTDGFKSGNVLLGYVFALVLTIGMVFYKTFTKQRRNQSVQGTGTLLHNETSRDE